MLAVGMKERTSNLTLSLPVSLLDEIEAAASTARISRTEWIRKACKSYAAQHNATGGLASYAKQAFTPPTKPAEPSAAVFGKPGAQSAVLPPDPKKDAALLASQGIECVDPFDFDQFIED